MTHIKQRAVGAKQKQQRIAQILQAAQSRFANEDFNDIRLVDIAADVGITKAALYRYFRNKELLFLSLYQQQIDVLVSNSEPLLAEFSLTKGLTKAILSVPLYSKLTSILPTILERNLTVEEAIEFKRTLASKMSVLVAKIAPYLSLPSEQVIQKFLMLHHCIIGAWPNCYPSDVVAAAQQQEPSIAMFAQNYEQMLASHIELIFNQ
ncbi:TetR/AcrR family transcriptional regulator [Thalassotalea sp. M1531]|uniref:TetR/AcrR family transcriptional regulator n=1 Tax=Thalassotalea algicola TaxID=2716224 RepID=A0A7Y0LAX4_9GAMM|nr:TetR family transcriptional regulator [Thalassotalea algicola]NMP30848.1 TetR/AcrR family transcriptional regulator [Thalassotalea algicola]